jgi:hypothetical protein
MCLPYNAIVEDACAQCSRDWMRKKLHLDLYVSSSGEKLAECEDRACD